MISVNCECFYHESANIRQSFVEWMVSKDWGRNRMDYRHLWASHYLLGVGLDGGYCRETVIHIDKNVKIVICLDQK